MRAVAQRPKAWTPVEGTWQHGASGSSHLHTDMHGYKFMAMSTNEADGSAYEGVEVASSSINVGLGSGAAVPPGLTAEDDGFPNHDL